MSSQRTSHKPDIVAIGASAGGVEAVTGLLAPLLRDLRASVLVVLHRQPLEVSHLAQVLAHTTKLHVSVGAHGDRLRHGHCIIGKPDRHLLVGPYLHLQLLPNGFYRAQKFDALFWLLALHAGRRTIGVILSGTLKDRTLGLKAIKDAGGVALVQSPEEAELTDVPLNAIDYDGR